MDFLDEKMNDRFVPGNNVWKTNYYYEELFLQA